MTPPNRHRKSVVDFYCSELEREMFPHQESEEEGEALTDVGKDRVKRVLRRMYDELVASVSR